ncbi:hypothetical protein O9G_005726, partial [Rozella allomycis CSF55]
MLNSLFLICIYSLNASCYILQDNDGEKDIGSISIRVIIICVLVLSGGLVAGLTIGLMSLDETNLRVLQRSDQPKQREYAAIIGPIRNRGHLLLCTLLIANTV